MYLMLQIWTLASPEIWRLTKYIINDFDSLILFHHIYDLAFVFGKCKWNRGKSRIGIIKEKPPSKTSSRLQLTSHWPEMSFQIIATFCQ